MDLPDRDDGAENYAAVMRPWLARFLDDQIKLNDFDGSEYLLAELAAGRSWTADLLYTRGELYRMRGHPRDLINAADFYRQSIALDGTKAKSFRGLGLALLRAPGRRRRTAGARPLFVIEARCDGRADDPDARGARFLRGL